VWNGVSICRLRSSESIAGDAHVKQLVLSHRMLRTLGKEKETEAEIRRRYSGPMAFADDLDCFAVR
jgi:ribonuclease BN (tRNA processing enzyme)